MTGPAAGRAPADGQRPGTRSGAALAVLLCLAVLCGGIVLRAPAAQAAPAPRAAPAGAVAAVPGDDASDPARPVTMDITRFEPRSVAPGATITINGTLTNTGDQTVTHLGVRLQRGKVLTTRAQLAGVDRRPDADTTVVPAFADISGRLEPGDSLTFSYAIAADELRLDRDGVYPVLLNVNGTVDGGERRRVGELRTYLVQQPPIPAGRTAVGWLWPLVERTHRTASGGFADDGLADAVRSGGRLDRALAAVEGLPRTVPPGGGSPVPTVPVTLAIDPALVEELEIMAAGPYAVAGRADAGRGTAAAEAFLDRLRAVAAVHPVVALPYGDVDADALEEAGLGEVLARTLPGRGTAEDRPGQERDGSVAPSSSAPTGEDGRRTSGAGARLLADALGVDPVTDLAWLPDGTVRPETLAALQADGTDRVVLGPAALTGGERVLGLDGGPATARTAVPLPGGSLPALVADPALGAVAGSTGQVAGGVRIAEQRYLADLALLSLHAPADPALAPTVLVAPPREVSADPEGVRAMMSDTAELPWLRPASLTDLTAAAPADTGPPAAPAAPALDPAGLADVAAAVAVRDDLAGAVVGAPDVALAPYDAAIARTVSLAWRQDAAGFRAATGGLREAIGRLRDRVTLLAPANGSYSLASSDAPLVLTVRNDLPFAVRVLLEVRTRGNVGLEIGDLGPQELAPGQRTTLQVPTHVRQTGRFAVVAALTTPSGGALGERVDIQVKSTAYGAISLIITIGAAGLLGLLFLRRLIRFVLGRRRGGPSPEEGVPPSAPEGAAVPQPPTRSPV